MSRTRTPSPARPWPTLQSVAAEVRRTLWHVIAFSGAINLLILTLPLFMIQVFDRVLVSNSFETLTVLAVGAVGALAVMAGLDLIRARVLGRVAVKFESDLSGELLSAGQSGRLNDVARVRNFLSSPAMATIMDVPWIPLFLIVLFILDPLLGWIGLGGALGMIGFALFTDRLTRADFKQSQMIDHDLSRFANVAGATGRELSVSLSRDGILDKFSDLQETATSQRLTLIDKLGAAASVGRFLRLALQIGLMTAAATLVINGQITAGGLVAASVIAARALGPVERAHDVWRQFKDARAAWSRLSATLIDMPRADRYVDTSSATHVAVQNLAWRDEYAHSAHFDSLSFNLCGGEMIGITGPSGSGKSILARLLVGIGVPTEGRVLFNDQDVIHATSGRYTRDIAYLSQSADLLPGTIAENIDGFSNASVDDVLRAARLAGADVDIRALPDGYNTRIGAMAPSLSKGLVQRILLARAYLARPRMLVLDEPYTFMDNPSVARLITTLNHLRHEGAAIVIVAQRPSVLAHCDRIVVLENGHGRVVERQKREPLRLLENAPELETASHNSSLQAAE